MKAITRIGALCLALVLVVLAAVPVYAVPPVKTNFTDMHVMYSVDVEKVESITDSYGNEHNGNIYRFNARYRGYLLLELKGEYLSFDGSLLASTDTASGASMSFAIFADGVEVFCVNGFTKQMDAQQIHLDLTGVDVLEFKSLEPNETRDSWIYITEGTFSRDADTANPYQHWLSLVDLVLIDSANYTANDRMGRDPYGELYFDHYALDARHYGYAMYNLNKGYDTFSCYVFPQRDFNADANVVVFFHVDGVEVAATEVFKAGEAVYMELDVRNAKTLKIVTTSVANIRDQVVYVASTKLTSHVHVPGEWVVDTPAECTAEGLQSSTCTVCGQQMDQQAIPALGHTGNGTWEVTQGPTCTEAGQQIQLCQVCGEIAATGEIPALGHTPGNGWEVVQEPTCTLAGEQVKYCTVCDEVAQSESVEMIPHAVSPDWEITREATCTMTGLRLKSCTVCQKVIESEEIPVIEHTYGQWYTVSGSAWNPPVVQERVCAACGDPQRSESNSTAWLKPTVIMLVVALLGGAGGLVALMAKKGLPIHPSSIGKLLKKDQTVDDSASAASASEDITMTPRD